jgi:hypothetical protein
MRVVGSLPLLLTAGVEDATHRFKVRHIPEQVVVQEYHNGFDEPPHNVVYALNTLLHHTGNHFTAHGFLPNGDRRPYAYFHDAYRLPLVRPPERDLDGTITYDWKVFRAWYTRVRLE